MNSQFATKPDFQVLSGMLWGGTNPTPGTGIAQAISASFSETAALAILQNTDPRPGGVIVIPRYLRLIVTAAPPSGTDAHLVIAVDNINRYTSGGTLITPGESRSDQLASVGNQGAFRFGAIVAPAASANRKFITRKVMKRAAPVVGDEFVIVFGDVAEGTPQSLTGTTPQVFTTTTDPVALMPGGAQAGGLGAHSLLFHTWFTGNITSGTAFEFEVGWSESPLW